MSDSVVFDRTVQRMQDRLDLSAVRQKVVSGNLANINTPGYVSKSLSFDDVLRQSLEEKVLNMVRSNEEHIDTSDLHQAAASPELKETGPVDLESEMVKLSENNIEYQFMVTMLNKKLSLLKHAIDGGR